MSDGPSFDIQQGPEIFLHSKTSRRAVGLGRPPTLLGSVDSCQMLERTVREAEYSSPSSAKVKWNGATPPLPAMPSWRAYLIFYLYFDGATYEGFLK